MIQKLCRDSLTIVDIRCASFTDKGNNRVSTLLMCVFSFQVRFRFTKFKYKVFLVKFKEFYSYDIMNIVHQIALCIRIQHLEKLVFPNGSYVLFIV